MPTRNRDGSQPSAKLSENLTLVQEVAALWFQLQERLQNHFSVLAAEQSLTAIQAKALLQLDPKPTVSMREVANRLQYDPSNFTAVIDELERRGFLKRLADPNDHRVKSLVITDKGLKLRSAFWHRLTSETGPFGVLNFEDLSRLKAILQTALNSRAPK